AGRSLLALLVCGLALSCGRSERPSGKAAPSAVPPKAPAAPLPAVETVDVATRARRPDGGPRPVLWIGLDGLDWEILDRLSRAGKMPHWTRLVSTGWSSRITSFVPILSPIVWTTVATGVSPTEHGVLDFQEVDPKSGQKVPISGRSRRVPAVWNLASSAGKKVGVVGWWATHPAEEVNGFFLTDHVSPILYDRLPLSGVAWPAALEGGVAQVIARDGRVPPAELSRFIDVPAGEVEQALASGAGMENPIVALSRIVGATRVSHRAARDLYDRNLPDLTMLYLEGTDEIGHVFGSDAPPRLACTPEANFARYGRAVDEYYAVIDRMLGQWMRRAGEDHATLIVQSDHGFKWGADRPCERSSLNWSTAAFWHRLDGVFAAWGERVKPGKSASNLSMFDPAPTVLALLGLAADRRMPGRPVSAAFSDLKPPPRADVASKVQVRRVEAQEMSSAQASEYAKKLLALGYLSGSETRPLAPPGGELPGRTEGAWNNLGLYERESERDLPAARAAFLKALELRPDYHSPMFNLAVLERTAGKDAQAQEWLFRSLAAGHADPPGTLRQWADDYERRGKTREARALAERALREIPANESVAREAALARFRSRDCAGALDALRTFETATRDVETLNALGLFHTCLGEREEAERLFQRSLAMNASQPGVVESLRVVRGGAPPRS
ncbi:MAG: alkaline phosphatase family protein, partial [Thermoanaerobaculia bacterium]